MDPELQAEIAADVAELEAEEAKKDGDPEPKTEVEEEHEDDVPEPGEEPDPKPDPKKDPPEKKEPPKEPAKIEAWRLKVAQDNWEKEKKELLRQIEEGKKAPPEKKSDVEQPALSEDEIDALAKKHGLDEGQKGLIAEIVQLTSKRVALPPELQEFLKEMPELRKVKATVEAQQAELAFDSDFERVVRPLVESEYSDVSPELLKSVKAKIREKISDPNFRHTPLTTLYKGEDDFRGLVPKKKAAESDSRPGSGRKVEVVDFETATDAEVAGFDDDTMEKFVEYQTAKERNRK
ncbi:MAG: hypothetical protein Q8L86_12500 [Vicinamibacterales bacterium]|nr:hypothetical protein [Vicinamibacterales bacterium]